MKFQIPNPKFKILNLKSRIPRLLLCLSGTLLLCFAAAAFAEEKKEAKWPGVDETVVEKYAKEHGREAREPFINTDQGDLLLFVFLIAGTAGGFAAGYYWRVLLEQRTKEKEDGNILGAS
jgi:hypothetical protein